VSDLALDPVAPPDPLLESDPARVADAATCDVLLRCWVREAHEDVPAPGELLRVALTASGATLEATVRHRSPSGWHRFDQVRFRGAGRADAGTVAALLALEATTRAGAAPHRAAEMAERVLGSARRVAAHVAARRAAPEDPTGPCSFLAGEQALLLGHPFHPAAKSREGASEAELAALSPELRGALRLHWFAADPQVVASGSALPAPAQALVRELAADVAVPAGTVPVPAHPWQAREVLTRPGIAELVDRGLLRDLGPAGTAWAPTSSLRTVVRPDTPMMLKLSLGLRITNSRRENLRSELALGLDAHRLLERLAPALGAAHPGFGVVREPAWIGVDPASGGPEGGLETALRERPFGVAAPVVCTAGLVAERPEVGRSRLAELLAGIADRDGLTVAEAAEHWVGRYVDELVAPVVGLLQEHGVGLEAHQQNTLVALDGAGWPEGGWYRDTQGFYVAAGHADRARALVPGLGDAVPVVFDDALVEDRVAYYLGVNGLLGLVGALGAEGVADEWQLLRQVRRRLEPIARGRDDGLARRLLDAPSLPCKANLLTCADGRDELDGPVEQQSIYVATGNPIAEAAG
jgi:siderophore synthetase component